MCGIGGVMMFPKNRSAEELQFIRLLATGIAVENQRRGRDSTGFVTFSPQLFNLFKHPMKADTMIETAPFKQYIRRAINRNTKNVLIHTRAGTKGSEQNNLNNHPIESRHYIGVHNGMIHNDDMLFKKHNLFRAAEVDSEVIFRLLDTRGDAVDDEGLKFVAEELSGAFTTAFVPKKDKNKMFLIRNDNPVTLFYIPSLNIIAFASIDNYVRSAFATAQEIMEGFDVPVDDTVVIEPKRNTIYKFDSSINNPLEQITQQPLSYKENWEGYGRQAYGWGEDDYFFHGGATEAGAQTVETDTKEEIASILAKLTDEELLAFDKFIEAKELFAWNDGWTKGRISLGEEMNQKAELSYEEGYNKGFDEGFEDGSKPEINVTV
jgi:glucosamine 6-phosphate synthetase-like amidotransferase/phosphosugar isomerase protein